MHCESLGEKTYNIVLDPQQMTREGTDTFLLVQETESGSMMFRMTPAQVSDLPTQPCCVTLTGDARIHVRITDSLDLVAVEEVRVTAFSRPHLAASQAPAMPMEIPY